MSKGVVNFFNFNEKDETLNQFNFTAVWSLRRVYRRANRAIRIFRQSDSTQTDIGFVGNDLDTAAINTFCSGTNGFIQIFYDQSGNGRNATYTIGDRAKIYDSSTGLNTTDGKVSCRFTNTTEYGFSQSTNTESIYFVASNVSAGTVNYLIFNTTGSEQPMGFWLNSTANTVKFAVYYGVGGDQIRGLNFLSGRNLGSFVYSPTASLYVINRNGGTDTFGNLGSSTSYPRFSLDRIGRNVASLSLNGDFQELLLGASGSNTGLSNKNEINTLINDYWSVY